MNSGLDLIPDHTSREDTSYKLSTILCNLGFLPATPSIPCVTVTWQFVFCKKEVRDQHGDT